MRRSTTPSLINRSLRFGATVTLASCALAAAGVVAVHREAPWSTSAAVAAAPVPNAHIDRHVEAVASTSPPSGTPVGGDLSAVFEVDPLPESTVVPEQVTAVAAVERVAPPAQPAAPVPVAAPAPAVSAPPSTVPVAATPAAEPVVSASHASVYDAVAAAFPEQPEAAYGVVLCESSGHPGTNTGNGYYGLWQFDLPTWQSVGGTGLPSQASVEEQVRRARMLYERRGWQPWGCAPR